MDKFWDLLGKSVITSFIVTTGVVGSVCYLAITGQEIPNTLDTAMNLILGFFFANGGFATGFYIAMKK